MFMSCGAEGKAGVGYLFCLVLNKLYDSNM